MTSPRDDTPPPDEPEVPREPPVDDAVDAPPGPVRVFAAPRAPTPVGDPAAPPTGGLLGLDAHLDTFHVDPDTEETPPTAVPGTYRFDLDWEEDEDDDASPATPSAPVATGPAAHPAAAQDGPVAQGAPGADGSPGSVAPTEDISDPSPIDPGLAAEAPPDAGPSVPLETSPGMPAAASPAARAGGPGPIALVLGGLVAGLLLGAVLSSFWPG